MSKSRKATYTLSILDQLPETIDLYIQILDKTIQTHYYQLQMALWEGGSQSKIQFLQTTLGNQYGAEKWKSRLISAITSIREVQLLIDANLKPLSY